MSENHSYCPFVFTHKAIEVRCEYRAEPGVWFAWFDLPAKPVRLQRAVGTGSSIGPGRTHVESQNSEAAKADATAKIDAYFKD